MNEPSIITSANNSIIKEVKSLKTKKGRVKAQAFLLEGSRLVLEAVHSGAKIKYLIVSDTYVEKGEALDEKMLIIKAIQISNKLFMQVSEIDSPQGIMAVAEIPQHNEHVLLSSASRVIALENIQDPGNLGTIIRTSDACGFDAVIVSKDSVDIYNPKVIRSTMGSVFHIPVLGVDDFYETLRIIKENGLLIVAAHTRNAEPCWKVNLSNNVAIIIGNEGNGISDTLLKLSDSTIMIPMDKRAESLNAAAAASILIYESMRQSRSTQFGIRLQSDI